MQSKKKQTSTDNFRDVMVGLACIGSFAACGALAIIELIGKGAT